MTKKPNTAFAKWLAKMAEVRGKPYYVADGAFDLGISYGRALEYNAAISRRDEKPVKLRLSMRVHMAALVASGEYLPAAWPE